MKQLAVLVQDVADAIRGKPSCQLAGSGISMLRTMGIELEACKKPE
ncbi:hypothetical protein [Rhodoferax lacus]|nr:hypothetical protein [Rhodoferax lacus]